MIVQYFEPRCNTLVNLSPAGKVLWIILAAGMAWSVATPALAQPRDENLPPAPPVIHVAATDDRLWLTTQVLGNRSLISSREPSGVFIHGDPINAVVVSITAAGPQAYLFYEDGSFKRYADGRSREALELPDRQIALHMIGVDGTLYALVPSEVASHLPAQDPLTREPTTRPFDPGNVPLSIVRYDGRGWTAVARCPALASTAAGAELSPRLCHLRGKLLLFWVSPKPPQIHYTWFDLTSNQWELTSGTIGVPRMNAFWAPLVNRLPTIVARTTTRDGDETFRIYRLHQQLNEGDADTWRPAELDLSPLPADTGPVSIKDAFGFNQHLGLHVADPDGAAYLQFGRFDGPSAIATFDVQAEPRPELPSITFQTLRFVVLLSILIPLFAFRRGSIAMLVKLPQEWRLEFTLRRLAGCACDLLPFSLATAVVLQINLIEGFREMASWAFNPQLNNTGLPQSSYLQWWLLSAAGYTIYSLMMELITCRTIGKVVMRTYLLSQSGTRPALWQILVRNLFRFIEVMPPFWILGFLVVLSRNRQRVGDIFAKTLAVHPQATTSNDNNQDDSGDPNQE